MRPSTIYDRHGHLLRSLNQRWLSVEYVDKYCVAVRNACNGRYRTFSFAAFVTSCVFGIALTFSVAENCFGFIDGTTREILKPHSDIQQEFYSGLVRHHAVKYQIFTVPSGLIANMWGPEPGRHHDMYLLAVSRLRERIQAKNQEWGREWCLYGDKGYQLGPEASDLMRQRPSLS